MNVCEHNEGKEATEENGVNKSSSGRDEEDVTTTFRGSWSQFAQDRSDKIGNREREKEFNETLAVKFIFPDSGVHRRGGTDIQITAEDVTIDEAEAVGGEGTGRYLSMFSMLEMGRVLIHVIQNVSQDGDKVGEHVDNVLVGIILVSTRVLLKFGDKVLRGLGNLRFREFNVLREGRHFRSVGEGGLVGRHIVGAGK
jgi:hypothetical protein